MTDEDKIREFLATRGATKCPTMNVVRPSVAEAARELLALAPGGRVKSGARRRQQGANTAQGYRTDILSRMQSQRRERGTEK